MVMLAAPAAPARDAVSAWVDQYDLLEREIDGWADRLSRGADPLTPGEQSRLRSLITAVKTLTPMPDGNAQVVAAATDGALKASKRSLDAALDRLPQHTMNSALEVAEGLGWRNIGNPTAVASIVNGNAGQMVSDWANLNGTIQDKLRAELGRGVALGQNPRVVAKRLRETLDGQFALGQSRSVTISRTVMAAAYDQASQVQYIQAAKEGIITGWEWLATLDDRTCPVCAELDGQVFPAGEPTFRHPNCRCATAPVPIDTPKAKQAYYDPDGGDLELRTTESGWTSWAEKPKKPKQAKPSDALTEQQQGFVGKFDDPDKLRWQMDDLYEMYEEEMRDAYDMGDRVFYDTAQIWGSDDYKTIQKALLDGDVDATLPQARTSVDEFLELADEAFDRVDPIPFQTQVTRLTRDYPDIQQLIQSPVGTKVRIDQYMATTVDPLEKLEMAGFGGNVQMNIMIPRGSQVMPIDAAQFSGVREAEILLNRGSELVLLEEPRQEGGRWILNLALAG